MLLSPAVRKHTGPKWEQTFTVAKLDRSEPDPAKFAVPKDYRITEAAPPAPRSQMPGMPGVCQVGGAVSEPRVIHSVNPNYSEQARRAKLNGICTVSLVVGADGVPTNIRVIRKLGMGLDEQAVLAAGKYRFEPAKLNGAPVPVLVVIEITFKTYPPF